MEEILYLLIGLSLLVVAVVGVMLPNKNRDDPQIILKDKKLRLIMIVALAVATGLFVVQYTVSK